MIQETLIPRLCTFCTNVIISDTRKSFSDYLLGTNLKVVAILSGYDELDRPISVKIEFKLFQIKML